MSTFQRKALRRGDAVFVHDARTTDLGVRAGVATVVDVRPAGHDVVIRLTTDTRTGPGVRPGRSPVHLSTVDDDDCWRFSDNHPQRPGIGSGPELSGVR
jgi:hypothetical protein